jgi:hypothetical protein
MKDFFLPIVIAAFTGGLSGAIVSLVAPWLNWGIEKKKMRLEAKRTLIKNLRSELGMLAIAPASKQEFRSRVCYAQVRPFLQKKTIDFIESDSITVISGGRHSGADNFKSILLDDISRLEKEWELI